MRIGVVGTFLAGSLSVAGAPTAVSAVNVVGTSTSSQALQRPSQDKVAYLHDGSLLVAYYDPTTPGGVHVKQVVNPSTAPVSTEVTFIGQGDAATIYTQQAATSTDIWIQVGNELFGGSRREQIQYGTYDGSTFTWSGVNLIPGGFTNGRQDPTVTWTGTWLIAAWWDDTVGGNSDTIFMQWTTDKTGASGWITGKTGTISSLMNAKNGSQTATTASVTKTGTIAAAAATATSVTYTVTGGTPAPAMNDLFIFGAGLTADLRTVTAVSGTGPYTLTVAALTNAHNASDPAHTVTQVAYTARSGNAPVAGDIYTFGAGLATAEGRTLDLVTGGGPGYTLTVPALNNAHGAGEIDTVTTWTIGYTPVTGVAPIAGELYQINNGGGTNAEFRQLTAVGAGTISFVGLVQTHSSGESVTQQAAILLTPVGSAIVQVSIRHSAKLGATIAVYGARSRFWYRTLLDTATNPSLANWSAETAIDPSFDDSEWGFGGPQIAIDETTGKIHVVRAVTTHGGSAWSGITYWSGTPSATPMTSGSIAWGARVVIDSTGTSDTNPPDVAVTVDAGGRVYVFWATAITGGAIKYATLVTPFTTFTPPLTIATTGANPRYPHVPAQAPLISTEVPLVYQSGSGTAISIYLDTSIATTSACAGTTLYTSYFSWFDKASAGMVNDNIHLLNTGASPSLGCVRLGTQAIPFSVGAGQGTYVTFPQGSIGGPVEVDVNVGPAVLASQRVQYYSSFNEVWAQSAAQAATTSYINWFDKASTGMNNDNIHLLNPGAASATVTVSLPGTTQQMVTVAPGAENYVTFPAGTIGGPVKVVSTQPVLASQRIQYYQTFNEVWAQSATQAAAASYVNWFDKASAGMNNDNIHLLNPGTTTASVTVSLPGATDQTTTVAAGAEEYVTFPDGTIGGPVTVTVTSGPAVLASQRVQYYASFNEVWAQSAAQAKTASYLTWYDKASAGMNNDNIHLLNPGLVSATVTVSVPGAAPQMITVVPGAEAYVTFAVGTIGGPVTVMSTQPVLASQRVQYYLTFNEIAAG